MSELIYFLRARLGEDERAAAGARDALDSDWWWSQPESAPEHHIARHDPARVLREVEAKRAILAEHEPRLEIVEWPHDQTGKGEAFTCPRCQNAANDSAGWHPPEGHAGTFPYEPFVTRYVLAPCPTLRLLALPYADHPDYREEWKP